MRYLLNWCPFTTGALSTSISVICQPTWPQPHFYEWINSLHMIITKQWANILHIYTRSVVSLLYMHAQAWLPAKRYQVTERLVPSHSILYVQWETLGRLHTGKF